MSTKIASLYAEIGADTTKLQTGLKSAKVSITDLKSSIDLAVSGFNTLLQGAQVVYEFGKAGAEIEYAGLKFERLSEKIGATSDALLTDLRGAVRGTMSDAEIMASAGDLMSLGLAKTSDQVVRMSKVVGGLGMDMNQLVLTLSNQTTMRFDQLGVSVDGFKEKVDDLTASGMDANAAFTEAFLQQAEEQLDKVGNKADTAAGKFQRFEAHIKQMGDQAKVAVSGPLADLLDWLLRADEATNAQADALEQGYGAIAGLGGGYGSLAVKMREAERASYDWNDAQREGMRATEEVKETTNDLVQTVTDYSVKQMEAAKAVEEYTGMSYGAQRALDEYNQRIQDSIRLQEDLADARQNLASAEQNWKDSQGGDLEGKIEGAWQLTEQQKDEARAAVDEVYGTALAMNDELKDKKDALWKDFIKTGDIEAFKSGMKELENEFMPFDDSVQKSQKLMDELIGKMEDFARTWTATVRINVGGGDGTSDIAQQELAYNMDLNGNGIIGAQYGADFVVPPGYNERTGKPFMVAVSSGEHVQVDPTGKGKSGNTYNLNVYTTQSAQVVQRGFQTMSILAGV